MNDDQLDRLLRAERDTVPPAAPREAMWDAIAARRQEGVVPIERARRAPRVAWPVGIAALLAIGFAVGRMSNGDAPEGAVVAASGPARGSVALAGATAQHLNRTETFLTSFRMDAGQSHPDTALVSGARELLSTTRLLLDSPGQSDARTRALLEELETILVQVAQLQNEPTEEAEILARQLDEQGVLPRLRVSIPTGPATATFTGES